MNITKKDREKSIEILKNYCGDNVYINILKRNVFYNHEELNDFEIEYILLNHNFKKKNIDKVIKIAKWYSEEKVASGKWDCVFIPEKIQIISLIGETRSTYNCYIRYKQNMEPKMSFIPKKAILQDFVLDDFHNINVDFGRYDSLSRLKDPGRVIREHQKDAVKFLLSRKKCILADDMGLGKTVSLSIAAIEGNFDSIVIICPASLKTNWKEELSWYVPERDITILESFNNKNKSELEEFLGYGKGKSGKKVAELLEEAKNKGKWQENRFVIVNYDIIEEFYKIPNGRSNEAIQKARKASPLYDYLYNKKSLIIIDEAHRLSNRTSIRYRTINHILTTLNPNSIYLATGTPITNDPQNYYNMLKLIDDPITDDWEYYMNRYCGIKKIIKRDEREKWNKIFIESKKKEFYSQLTKEEKEELKEFVDKNAKKIPIIGDFENLDELKDRTSHLYLRRTKEDLNDLVEKRIHEVFYDFTETQKNEYDKLWDEYEQEKLNEDPSKELNKDLLEGAIYRKYCSDQMVPNTIKMAEDFIEKGEKVVIACCYDDELYSLKEHFGKKSVIYNGKMSSKEKDNAKNAFLNDENVVVFIGNIIAAGVGITLTSSRIIIFNNMSFVPGDCQQFQDRVHRIGQKRDVDIYYQMFRNTQYEKIWNTIMRKSLVINQVIKKEDEK